MRNRRFAMLILGTLLLLTSGLHLPVGPDLELVRIYTCDLEGEPKTFRLGEGPIAYAADVRCLSGAGEPFEIRFNIRGRTTAQKMDEFIATPGATWSTFYSRREPFHFPHTITVTVVPTGDAVDPNPGNNELTLAVNSDGIPDLDLFDARRLSFRHHIEILPAGQAEELEVFATPPVSDAFQKIGPLSISPGFEWLSGGLIAKKPMPTAELALWQETEVVACAERANPTLQDRIGWSDYAALDTRIGAYATLNLPQTEQDAVVAFCARHLPADFRETLKPLQVAQRLFQGVIAELVYNYEAPANPSGVISLGYANCEGMSGLYVSALRSVGLPARVRPGWVLSPLKRETGELQSGHQWSEIYVPSIGWLPQDVTFANSIDDTGSGPFYFWTMPDLNDRVSMGTGELPRGDGYSTAGTTGIIWNAKGQNLFHLKIKISASIREIKS